MYAKRIIPCLDVSGGRVVKGVNFVNLIDAGDPVECAKVYDEAGADELVFLDITASSDARETVVDMVERVAKTVFIPFTVGGGIRTVEDFRNIKVVYTKEAETADTYIEKTAHKLSKNHIVRVATSDGPEQMIILGSGALRVPANSFIKEVTDAEKAIRDYISSL